MNEQAVIPLNKKRMLPNLLGAMVFVIAGSFMLVAAIAGKGQLFGRVVFLIVGLAALLFFGAIAWVMLAKIVRRRAGLIISDKGLTDNSSGLSAGFIAWNDIRKINVSYTGKLAFLVVVPKNPEKYIQREGNPLKRLAMRMNYKMSGSPIHILASYLDTDLHSLNALIAERRYQKKPASGQG